MALVPSLDLRGRGDPRDQADALPANVEAEQALLGALMFDSVEASNRLSGALAGRHFFEPFHGRLFTAIKRAADRGRAGDAILFAEMFRADPAFRELGGIRYLADLVDRAPPGSTAGDYEREILDAALRRDLIAAAQDVIRAAHGRTVDDDGIAVGASDIASEFERTLSTVRATSSRDELVDLGVAARGVVTYVNDRSTPVGVLTGLAPLDLQMGAIAPDDLVVIGGRPSMGKSALAIAISKAIAMPEWADTIAGRDYDGRPPGGVIEIHGEMAFGDKTKGGQVARRHIADLGYALHGRRFPTYRQIKDRHVSYDQMRMIEEVVDLLDEVPIRGIKRTGLRLGDMRALARRQAVEWRRRGIAPGAVIVDHGGLIRPDGRTSGRYEAQTEIAMGSKIMADDLGVPLIVLVQLSRDVERRDDKRPQLSDLRDSGGWEENADSVLFVYRDAYYAAREKEPDVGRDPVAWDKWDRRRKSHDIDVILGKIREGGAGGSATLFGDLPWNVIRGSAPDNLPGDLL